MAGPPDLTMRGERRWLRFFEERSDGEWYEITRTTRRQTPFQLRAKFREGEYLMPRGTWEMEVGQDGSEWVLWARAR